MAGGSGASAVDLTSRHVPDVMAGPARVICLGPLRSALFSVGHGVALISLRSCRWETVAAACWSPKQPPIVSSPRAQMVQQEHQLLGLP